MKAGSHGRNGCREGPNFVETMWIMGPLDSRLGKSLVKTLLSTTRPTKPSRATRCSPQVPAILPR
jgi:hypothetical protein